MSNLDTRTTMRITAGRFCQFLFMTVLYTAEYTEEEEQDGQLSSVYLATALLLGLSKY